MNYRRYNYAEHKCWKVVWQANLLFRMVTLLKLLVNTIWYKILRPNVRKSGLSN